MKKLPWDKLKLILVEEKFNSILDFITKQEVLIPGSEMMMKIEYMINPCLKIDLKPLFIKMLDKMKKKMVKLLKV